MVTKTPGAGCVGLSLGQSLSRAELAERTGRLYRQLGEAEAREVRRFREHVDLARTASEWRPRVASTAPRKRGRDEGSRSGLAQIGKRVAWAFGIRHGRDNGIDVRLAGDGLQAHRFALLFRIDGAVNCLLQHIAEAAAAPLDRSTGR